MHPAFIKPHYDSQGFAALPGRITRAFSGTDRFDCVVLILIDGLGWRSFEKFQSHACLEWIAKNGTVEKITSQFPSTTSALLTTLHSGLPVGVHGVLEWYYFEPVLDALIAPLLFSYAGTTERDTLRTSGVKPEQLYPVTTLYQQLKASGISSTIFQHREYTPSTYGNVLFAGASTKGYRSMPAALVDLGTAVRDSKSPSCFVFYYDRLDGVSHEYGPGSRQAEAEMLSILEAIKRQIIDSMSRLQKKVLFLLTADHGLTETNPATTIYLNRDPRFRGLDEFLRKNKRGQILTPAGSARDYFIYIQPGLVEEAGEFLSRRLAEVADVCKVADLVAEGWFGPEISATFLGRAGDLVILPYEKETIWWYERNRFEQNYLGHHGGLTSHEVEIPLLAWDL